MSKTKPQAKMINKFVVFWQANMSWYLLRLIIRQQTFLKYLKCSWFCQSFTAEFIEDVYKKTTKAYLQLLVNRDLKHQRRNATTTLTRSEIFPVRTFWACIRLSKPHAAFINDEIQGGLPLSLKHNYKTILFACKSLFFSLVIQYK